jgi:hypothetical protein
LGTITILGSFPLFSDFRLGRFAGGGIRRAVATFPRLCKPCRGITAGKRGRTDTTQQSHKSTEASSPCTQLREKDRARQTKPSALQSVQPLWALHPGPQRQRGYWNLHRGSHSTTSSSSRKLMTVRSQAQKAHSTQ